MRFLIFTIMTVTIVVPAMGQDLDSRSSLNPGFQNWRLSSSADINMTGEELSRPGVDVSAWHPTAVPKTVLAALVDNDVYPDPYYGVNMKSIPGYQEGRWLIQAEDSPFRDPWWYRVEFSLPEEPEEEGDWYYTLHFEGINYAANIWLNGKLVAGRDQVIGMFRRFEFPVTSLLVHGGGKNALAVEIIPPGLLQGDVPRTKQVEATTGWDDHNPQPPDMNMGLWQPVYLHREREVGIRNPYVESDLDLPGLEQARLTVSAWLHNNTNSPVECTLSGTIEEREFSQPVTLEAQETREVFFRPEDFAPLVIDAPRVWWPHPTGKQELYQLELKAHVSDVLSNKVETPFGIRDITTYINEDDWRGYRVNGRNILIRGGAWMTCDMLLNLEPSRYDALVRYAREANFNMLRSEGFSIRETDTFYDLCDRYGVMVTQQIFGRSIPDEALAIACIEDTLLRIRNHPSLAHFLGHDETFPTETLDQAYRDLLKKHRIRRTYQPHSGTFTITTRAKTGGTRTGTRELWTYAGPSHYYWTEERRFDTAWGFAQSGGIGGVLAARDSIRQMMPENALWPLEENETWSFHTVLQGIDYFDAVFKAMERAYGPASDFDTFCDKLYALNYNSARGMFEAYARHKYDALGITTWKYDAAWPAALTWQYVDWYKRASAAYYGAKKACTPLHALYAHDDQGLYVVNSFYEPRADLSLYHAVYGLDGQKHLEEEHPVSVDADGRVRVASFEAPESAGDPFMLRLELRDAEKTPVSINTYWLSRTPDIPGKSGETKAGIFYTHPKSAADFTALNDLPETTVAAVPLWQDHRLTVELANESPHIAFQLELALFNSSTGREQAATFWSDNFLTLVPGERREITAVASNAEEIPKSLALRIRGYNIQESILVLE